MFELYLKDTHKRTRKNEVYFFFFTASAVYVRALAQRYSFVFLLKLLLYQKNLKGIIHLPTITNIIHLLFIKNSIFLKKSVTVANVIQSATAFATNHVAESIAV